MDLRKYAHGKPCMIRLPGCTHQDGVLAHLRMKGITGGGQKAPDVLGAWACPFCHDVVDGRSKPPEGYTRADVERAHLDGITRTQYRLVKDGVLSW